VIDTIDLIPAKTLQRREVSNPKSPRVSFERSGKRAREKSWGLSASNTTRTVDCPHPTGSGNKLQERAYSVKDSKKKGGQLF
jgi:hypothetical protein